MIMDVVVGYMDSDGRIGKEGTITEIVENTSIEDCFQGALKPVVRSAILCQFVSMFPTRATASYVLGISEASLGHYLHGRTTTPDGVIANCLAVLKTAPRVPFAWFSSIIQTARDDKEQIQDFLSAARYGEKIRRSQYTHWLFQRSIPADVTPKERSDMQDMILEMGMCPHKASDVVAEVEETRKAAGLVTKKEFKRQSLAASRRRRGKTFSQAAKAAIEAPRVAADVEDL